SVVLAMFGVAFFCVAVFSAALDKVLDDLIDLNPSSVRIWTKRGRVAPDLLLSLTPPPQLLDPVQLRLSSTQGHQHHDNCSHAAQSSSTSSSASSSSACSCLSSADHMRQEVSLLELTTAPTR